MVKMGRASDASGVRFTKAAAPTVVKPDENPVRRGRAALPRLTRWLSPVLLAGVLAATGTTGCKVDEKDIERWEKTQLGPDKLRAVLLFPKYDTNLRVQASLALIRMKPRSGRELGIETLAKTLAEISPQERAPILASLVPAIITEIKKPPPAPQADQKAPPDPSFAYKDAAYALLTFDKAVLIEDETQKASLKQALIEWAMADFERRLENRSQAYGMEQLLRYLGPDSVAGLPKLLVRDSRNLDKISSLIAELGSDATKEEASKAIVDISSWVVSNEWVNVKTPLLQQANAQSKLQPNEKQFKAQLAQFQDEELARVVGSMKKLGGRPVIDWALKFAADKDQSETRRQAVLSALEGRLDRKNADDMTRIFAIAMSDAPPVVLDQAFRRISEMPRDSVVEKLYDVFKTDKWKTRRAAAGVVLRMSTMKHVDEFMSKLPDKDAKGFAMSEALVYGTGIGDLKEGNARDAVKKYLTEGTAAQRTTAISLYYQHGTPADLPTLAPLETDNARTPVCDTDNECKWICVIPKESDPKQTEEREIKTMGDFVKHCIEPAIKERAAKPKEQPKPGDAPAPSGTAAPTAAPSASAAPTGGK